MLVIHYIIITLCYIIIYYFLNVDWYISYITPGLFLKPGIPIIIFLNLNKFILHYMCHQFKP